VELPTLNYPMRILTLTNLYPNPFQPQRATFNRHQLRLLGERYPVRVIAPIAWSDELRSRGAGKPALPRTRRVERDGLIVDHPRVYHLPGMLGWYGQLYYRSVRRTFNHIAREFKPTLIFAPWIYPDGWAALNLAREIGLPAVLKTHGSDVLLLKEHPSRKAGTIEALRGADGVIAVSQDLANATIQLGAYEEKVRVIYNALDGDLFRPGAKSAAREKLNLPVGERVVLFVGNLVPVKGIDVLLEACARLSQQGTAFQLHIVGQGPLRGQLQQQAERLGTAGRVHWHGSIPQVLLPEWYQAADVFVLPSRSEGVPNVLLEASGCETPWVATRVGGIPEIAEMGRGRIVSSESPVELAAAIAEQLESPVEMGGRPRRPEDTVSQMAEFFLEVQQRHSESKLTFVGM
jgi:glycosyltransferase involved in cell wall biosynthesis